MRCWGGGSPPAQPPLLVAKIELYWCCSVLEPGRSVGALGMAVQGVPHADPTDTSLLLCTHGAMPVLRRLHCRSEDPTVQLLPEAAHLPALHRACAARQPRGGHRMVSATLPRCHRSPQSPGSVGQSHCGYSDTFTAQWVVFVTPASPSLHPQVV